MEKGNRNLNAGCGHDYREDWVNLDYIEAEWVDVVHDLTVVPLPFPDNHFDLILFKDVMEHLPKEKVPQLLDEFHRILESGGRLEIITPWGLTFNLHHVSSYNEHSLDSILTNPPRWWGNSQTQEDWRSKGMGGLQYKKLFRLVEMDIYPFRIPCFPINIFGQRLRWLLEKPRTG